MAAELPSVHLRRDVAREVVAGQLRDGTWVPVRRGAYTDTPLGAEWEQRRHRALAAAVATQRQLKDAVLSDDTAALVHELKVWRIPDVTSVIQRFKPRAGLPPDVRRHTSAISEDDIIEVNGLRVTRLPRTIVDCARRLHPRDALVVADSGMRAIVKPRREDSREDVEARTEALRSELWSRIARGSRGAVQARAIIAAADPLAESAPESVVRWIAISRGMPRPALQQRVTTARGTFYTDLAWRFRLRGKVIWFHVEFDGTAKYRDDPTRRDVVEVVLDERRREAAITDTGDLVLRIYSDEITDEDRVFRKITERISRSVVDTYRRDPTLFRPSTWR